MSVQAIVQEIMEKLIKKEVIELPATEQVKAHPWMCQILNDEKIRLALQGKIIKKFIVVPDKFVNIVTEK